MTFAQAQAQVAQYKDYYARLEQAKAENFKKQSDQWIADEIAVINANAKTVFELKPDLISKIPSEVLANSVPQSSNSNMFFLVIACVLGLVFLLKDRF